MNEGPEPHKPALAKFTTAIAEGSLLPILVVRTAQREPTGYGPSSFGLQIGTVDKLGMVVFQQYWLPFELASVMLSKRETGERNF